tara:strand:+ start:44 stop:247 length:204 start_codon:yes stop_codon:yes gene_type:complete
MEAYLVEVNAVVWKQIEVRAESVEAAETQAHALFDLSVDGCPERYDQKTSQIWKDDSPNIRNWKELM